MNYDLEYFFPPFSMPRAVIVCSLYSFSKLEDLLGNLRRNHRLGRSNSAIYNDMTVGFQFYDFLLAMGGEGDKEPYGNGDGKVDDKELQKYLDDTMTYYARRYYGRDQRAQITTIN